MIWQMWAAWSHIWIEPWALAFAIFSLVLCWKIRWKSRLMPLAMSYIIALSTIGAYSARNFSVAPSMMSSLLAVASFLAYCSVDLSFISRIWRMRALYLACLIGFFLCILAPLFETTQPVSRDMMPLLWNRSMGASAIVILFEIAKMSWAGTIVLLTIRKSTPIAVFLAMKLTRYRKPWLAVFCILAACVMLYLEPNGAGRFPMWREYLAAWWNSPLSVILFGSHMGSTAALLPLVQVHNHGMGRETFLWLHCDYLQALCEFGVIGLGLLLAAAVELILIASFEQRVIAAGLLVFMLTDYPWHWMPEAMLYWCWIKKNAVSSHV